MRTPLVLSPALAFGLLVLFSAGSPASAQVASDDAARTVYDNGWQTGDDGDASPNGFAAWTLSPGANTGNAGFFIGSSTNNNDNGPAFAQANGQSDVNTGERFTATRTVVFVR